MRFENELQGRAGPIAVVRTDIQDVGGCKPAYLSREIKTAASNSCLEYCSGMLVAAPRDAEETESAFSPK